MSTRLAGRHRGIPGLSARDRRQRRSSPSRRAGRRFCPRPDLSERVGATVWLKLEGINPTGSFKDRGMTVAISKALEEGAKAVVCGSTGNTSASAAAYAARAGLTCAVLIPEGYIALGKLAQALIHGARVLQIRANFDAALDIVRQLGDSAPVTVVNSINPYRIEGQKTGAFEIVDVLGDAPDVHCIPVGNAGNITAYWKGYRGISGCRPPDQAAPNDGVPGGRSRSDRGRPSHRGPRHASRPRFASGDRLRGMAPPPRPRNPEAASRRSPTTRSWPPIATWPRRSRCSVSRRRRHPWPVC